MASTSPSDLFQTGQIAGVPSGYKTAVTNPALGLQHGVAVNLAEFAGQAAHLRPAAQFLVLRTPGVFKYLPGDMGKAYSDGWRSIWEGRSEAIEGVDLGLETEMVKTLVGGGSGQELAQLAKVKTKSFDVTTRLVDPVGRPYQRMFESLITLEMNAYGGQPGILALNPDIPQEEMEHIGFWSGMVLAYVMSPSRKSVDAATLLLGVRHNEMGENKLDRDLSKSLEKLELSIPWSAVSQPNDQVLLLAQRLHDDINEGRVTPWMAAAAATEIDPSVAASTTGSKTLVDNVLATGVAARA